MTVFALLWGALSVGFGISIFVHGDMEAVWAAAILSFPSSLLFGGIARAIKMAISGDQNLYFDFFSLVIGGLVQYLALGYVVGVAIGKVTEGRIRRYQVVRGGNLVARSRLCFVSWILPGYVVGWLLGYFMFVGSDAQYLVRYFLRGWTGAGEIPSFIQAVAIAAAPVVAGVATMARTRYWRGSQRPRKS